MVSKENILHYIWKYKLFPFKGLKTSLGEFIEVISPGYHNSNAGPDFYEARIKIGDTLWVGSVEIHVLASDWNRHNHQTDQSYDNVILHVVWQNDIEISRIDGTKIPALELKPVIEPQLIEKIEKLRNNEHWIPCQEDIHKIDDFTYKAWIDRILVERLTYKSETIRHIYSYTKGSWEGTFYILLAGNFGFKVNQQPFEMLAKNLPQQILARHKSDQQQIESLVFGVAGFLEDEFEDEYPNILKREFRFLQHKYNLKTLDKFIWKFAKTRPDNFPTIRLAEFAGLIYKSSHLFSRLLEIKHMKDYRLLFTDLTINPYWFEHYNFDKPRIKEFLIKIGTGSIDNLLINSISPILFFYGDYMDNQSYKDSALSILASIKAEDNQIINGFRNLGLKVSLSSESQGLIHLKNFYCNQKKCLNCAFGIKILKH